MNKKKPKSFYNLINISLKKTNTKTKLSLFLSFIWPGNWEKVVIKGILVHVFGYSPPKILYNQVFLWNPKFKGKSKILYILLWMKKHQLGLKVLNVNIFLHFFSVFPLDEFLPKVTGITGF